MIVEKRASYTLTRRAADETQQVSSQVLQSHFAKGGGAGMSMNDTMTLQKDSASIQPKV